MIVDSGMSALTVSVMAFHVPSVGTKRKPVPAVPAESMKPSAATMFDTVSVADAVTRTAGVAEFTPTVPLVAVGATVTPDVVGPVLSMVSVIDE